jgi:hypothetical protein
MLIKNLMKKCTPIIGRKLKMIIRMQFIQNKDFNIYDEIYDPWFDKPF